jgi:hypothetical protein
MRRFGIGSFKVGLRNADEWLHYAYVYKDSIQILFREIRSNFSYQHDSHQLLPLLFLLEMYIELQLKGLIIYKGGEPKYNRHDLSYHLHLLESIDSSIRMSKQTKDFIMELNKLDESSQAFRYPTDKHLQRFFRNLSLMMFQKINDFEKLEPIVNLVIHDLENIEGDFRQEQDNQEYS